MEKESLPIKFFAKREEDKQRVEGGGGKNLPKWILSGDDLNERSNQLRVELDSIFTNINWEKRQSVPVVIKAQMSDDSLAKSHRGKIKELFATKSSNIIGLYDENTLMIKVADKEDEQIIRNKISKTEQYAYALSCIESLSMFSATIQCDKEVDNYKVKLIDFQNYAINLSYGRKFELNLEKKSISFQKTKYSELLTVYKLLRVNKLQLDALEESEIFDLAFEVKPMPKIEIDLDVIESEKRVQIKYSDEQEKSVVVGVLDNGIEIIDELKPWIAGKRMSPYPDDSIDATHGTFVAGVITYGDELQGETLVGAKNIRVFDAAVFPNIRKEGLEEDELIQNIREIIKSKCSEIKIWNLSISIKREIEDDKFSDFAVALDSIQDECNVLICKSAGNCTNFSKGLPIGRIHEGADSVRSLVVGSITEDKQLYDIGDANNPSPFSRIGPGPSYIIKPELAHYGGNAGVDKRGNVVESGVYSFSKSGSIIEHAGTSFSTPRVTALAAGLYREMQEEFDPLLLKGLIIHSANYPEGYNIPNNERTKFSGFGVPATVSNILYNAPNEATLILRDTMGKGQFIDIKDFPMPNCLIKDGYFTGQIIVTLVYDPIVISSQGFEYCQSNMDVRFGSYDGKTERDISKSNILNPVGRDGTQNLLLDRLYSKTKMNNNNIHEEFAKKERLLIQYGDKYYPVKKYAVDFSELTDGNKTKYLSQDKHWFLTLDSVYRNYIEEKANNESIGLSQEFCLIITIRDPYGIENVYTGVTQKLNEYNFWHSNIKVSEHINVQA